MLAIGDHFHDLNALYKVATLAIIPLNLWAIALSVALYQEHPSLSPANSE